MKKTQVISRSNSSGVSSTKEASRRLSRHLNKRLTWSNKVYDVLENYQRDAVDSFLEVKTAGLYFEQRTGKTYVVGGIIEKLLESSFLFTGIVIVPLTTIETVWLPFLEEFFDGLMNIHTDTTEFMLDLFPKILVTNYEQLPPYIKKIRKTKWTLIVYDEAHRLKERSSLSSRTAAKLRNSADYKIALTGTPIEHEPVDLWAQFRFFAPDVLGDRWKDFEDEFMEPIEDFKDKLKQFRPGSLRWKKVIREMMIARRKRKFNQKKLPQFLRRIKRYCWRVDFEEVYDSPGIEIVPMSVRLRGNQRVIYEDLATRGQTILSGHRVSAPMKAVLQDKLHQVCGGYVIDDEGQVHEVGQTKLRKTMSLIQKHDKPIVIFCRYVEEILALSEWIGTRTKLKVQQLFGEIKRGRAQILEDFQAGKIDVLICQLRTGGVGVEMWRSCTAIAYSWTYSWIDFDQMVKRLMHRDQENKVKIFLIYAKGTVDEEKYNVVVSKGKGIAPILHQLKRSSK